MEHKYSRSSSRESAGSSSAARERVVKEAVASVIVNERSKYESKIRESQTRLTKYTAENDRLLDEVSNLRLQIREMKNDRSELVRAHQESMFLLAQVSEEKLVEYKSKSEQDAMESRVAQEEALRTVLEMMEKDCADRVAELDNELARVEEERERATQLQIEMATKADEEGRNKEMVEEAAKLALQKLVEERTLRGMELQNLEERERQLKQELEMTKQRSEMERRELTAAAEAVATSAQDNYTEFSQSYDSSVYSSDRTGSTSTRDSSRFSVEDDVDDDDDDDNGEEEEYESPGMNQHKFSDSPFLNDPPSEMTRGRRIALWLQQYSWYQPRGKKKHWDQQGRGLQNAWAYFEHSILPRFIIKNADGSMPTSSSVSTQKRSDRGRKNRSNVSVYESDETSTDAGDDAVSNGDSDVDDWLYTSSSSKPKYERVPAARSAGVRQQRLVHKGNLNRAKPGESNVPTRLYSPFFTPLSQLGDFGIGVGLYFSSLRAVAFIALVAGCINLPNILYYASDAYSNSQPGIDYLLKGSAICTEQVWVPCPNCSIDEFHYSRSRIGGTATVTPDGELQTLVFALKNACDGATFRVGLMNMASLGFILFAFGALTLYQRRKQITYDEQEQTAQDYSIEIFNPPADATEPEEWKEFFETRFGGHLTCCTVTIDNDLLVKALAQRRDVLSDIEELIDDDVNLSTLTLSQRAAKIEHGRLFLGRLQSMLSPGIPELVDRLTVLNTRIQGLVQQDYRATRVFCTFETEATQRQVLSRMTVGAMTAMRNNTHRINSNLLFRGEHVLLVREAEEPSAIRWMDLDERWSTKIKQITFSTIISLAVIVAVAAIVYLCRRNGVMYAALAISVANAIFPMIAKAVTHFESHSSEAGKQISLYIKIAIFRWVITAIVITIITPFTSTITEGPEHLLQSVYIIFFADLVTSNVLQLADPVSNFNRHFLAPRARTQERMNLLMSGTEYSIAERYTNMSKTLFLTFYYCAIYPGTFFLCATILFVSFYVDKFSLMRTWKPAPMLGPSVAMFSRIYLMSSAIAALGVASSYWYSGFPFDNLCSENTSPSAYYGNWKITDGEGQESIAVIEPGSRSYYFCNQFIGPGNQFSFPAIPPPGAEWMTSEQMQLTEIYGWVSVGVIGVFGLFLLYRILRSIKHLFGTSHKSVGKVQGIPYSQVGTISTYAPQVTSDRFAHPLLAVNIDNVDESLLDWSDPNRSHSFYDLTRDAEQLMKGREDMCHGAFGQIRHWPPGEVAVDGAEGAAKSALRRSKFINPKQNSVSWSSKVTCKTYSKDDPNHYNSFNANVSISEGMNFNGRTDPIYDPHAQNEARVYKDNPQAQPGFDPFGPNDGNLQSNNHTQQPHQNHLPPNQHFDQYYGTGLDYPNQIPDPMYGDSQDQDFNQSSGGSSWEGSDGTGSYQQSNSSGTAGSQSQSYNSSYNSALSGSGSNSVAESGSQGESESAASSRGSASYADENLDGLGEYDESEVYENDQFGDSGSYSRGELPPVT
ncbi:hypothetical protein ACHAXH_007776 [Discostella pseudostelligera]